MPFKRALPHRRGVWGSFVAGHHMAATFMCTSAQERRRALREHSALSLSAVQVSVKP